MKKSACLFVIGSMYLAGVMFGQSGPVIVGAGYAVPTPMNVAPGQIITLLVQGLGNVQPIRTKQNPWPTELSGITVTLEQGANRAVPLLEVRNVSTCNPLTQIATCGNVVAITVQIPFNIITICGFCIRPLPSEYAPTRLSVSYNGIPGPVFDVYALGEQIHLLTSCDTIVSPAPRPYIPNGVPCPPLVTHGDGSPVSFTSPAQAGEELTAYAVGLGNTVPVSVAGRASPDGAVTATSFITQFNYTPNSLPSRPRGELTPLFTGVTPGYAGLYQINFLVPTPPGGTLPCIGLDISQLSVGANVVQSNLTVSFGGDYSFDGVGICVAVP